jgi:hypothetical protein
VTTSAAIVVFARAPELGRVKTRLAPALGEKRTLDLYRAFLADTLASARATGARVVLAHTATATPFEAQATADACVVQRGESFGARFDAALADVAGSASRLLIVGADAPHVGPAELGRALRELETRDAVLGPSTDGGFYALGVRSSPPPSLASAFDGPNEAAEVARRLRPALLPPSFDVDVPRDLASLVLHLETLEAAGAWTPPRTREALRALRIRVAPAESGARERALLVNGAPP